MMITKETLDFLFQNRMQDSRSWYQEHKKEYQQFVLEPLKAIVEKMGLSMLEIDPLLVVTPKVDKTISRIYRDTRFSKDKSLYRDVMWIVFCRDKKLYDNIPGFVFEFSPNGFRYGCGFYQASPAVMEEVRSLILKKDKSFIAAKNAADMLHDEFPLSGDLYKRNKFREQPEEMQNWLNRKNLDFLKESEDFELLFSDRLPDVILGAFQSLSPIYQFLMKAVELEAIKACHS